MIKQLLFLFGILFSVFTPTQIVKSNEVEKLYVTTEDIILDIIFPTVDKRVLREYGKNSLFDWQWKGIVDISYEEDHSYDVTIKIEIPSNKIEDFKEDIVQVKISPSCDSDKINKQKCNHGFTIEILKYEHVKQ
ncbi:hypothetical protein ACH0B5_04040 [Ureibacillus sp. 179-F W5.1 NHS]|uniref:hypothetical protein n=1 Tax=Ureibacillus sp. 179-F W5.1 NHS TaxID=3374297 RepID=UPI00387A54D0